MEYVKTPKGTTPYTLVKVSDSRWVVYSEGQRLRYLMRQGEHWVVILDNRDVKFISGKDAIQAIIVWEQAKGTEK